MFAPRFAGLMLALSLTAAGTAAQGAEPLPTDPRLRLAALQNALVKAAMAGQTRVRSAAYIDSSGQLHETTRITSDMKVRGVRVLSYLEEEGGTSARIAADSKSVTNKDEACRANAQKYRREATLETAQRIVAPGAGRYDWTVLMTQARARLVAQAAASRKWSLTAATRMPDLTYERLLTGAQPDTAPFHMTLELLPAGALGVTAPDDKNAAQYVGEIARGAVDYVTTAPPRRPAQPFVMRLTVTERSSQKLVWQDALPLSFPEGEITSVSQPLPPAMAATLDKVLQQWLGQLDTSFGCRPLQFNVLQEAGAGWIINGGQTAGLSVGDQLLMMDRDHLPQRILEPQSAQYLALVEVVNVKSGLATIRKLAGPAAMPKAGDWIATPF